MDAKNQEQTSQGFSTKNFLVSITRLPPSPITGFKEGPDMVLDALHECSDCNEPVIHGVAFEYTMNKKGKIVLVPREVFDHEYRLSIGVFRKKLVLPELYEDLSLYSEDKRTRYLQGLDDFTEIVQDKYSLGADEYILQDCVHDSPATWDVDGCLESLLIHPEDSEEILRSVNVGEVIQFGHDKVDEFIGDYERVGDIISGLRSASREVLNSKEVKSLTASEVMAVSSFIHAPTKFIFEAVYCHVQGRVWRAIKNIAYLNDRHECINWKRFDDEKSSHLDE